MLAFGSTFFGSRNLYHDNTAVSITENTTNERIVALVPIPAGVMGTDGSIHGQIFFSTTSSANAKTFRIYLGNGTGTVGGALTANTSTAFITVAASSTNTSSGFGFWIGNRASAAVNAGGMFGTRGTGVNIAIATGTINTAAAQNLIVTATKGLGTETITLETLRLDLVK
jgi:hypothetical protein